MKPAIPLDPTDPIVQASLKPSNELALQIVKKLRIPDLNVGEALDAEGKHYGYYVGHGGEVILHASIMTGYVGIITSSVSLSRVALSILYLMRKLTNNDLGPDELDEEAAEILKRKGVKMTDLFGIDPDEDLEPILLDHAEKVLELFLENIPFFTHSVMVDAIEHSKLGYVLNRLSPKLKDRWQELGLPKKFSIFSKKQIEEVREYDIRHRHWFLGDRKKYLKMDKLPTEADKLLDLYKKFVREYREIRQSYFKLNRRSDEEEWKSEWRKRSNRDFPNIPRTAVEELLKNPDVRPYELRNLHLAEFYGYDTETIRGKISEARSLTRKNTKTKE